jgi:hypothetical protein
MLVAETRSGWSHDRDERRKRYDARMSEQPQSTESPTAGEDDAGCQFPLRPSEVCGRPEATLRAEAADRLQPSRAGTAARSRLHDDTVDKDRGGRNAAGRVLVVDFLRDTNIDAKHSGVIHPFHLGRNVDLFQMCMGSAHISSRAEFETLFAQAGLSSRHVMQPQGLVSLLELEPRS